MRRKLQTKIGRAIYAARKAIVEPVFGQIKQARGFRQFLLRGLKKVQEEWVYGPQCFETSSAGLHVTTTGETRTQFPGSEHQPGTYPGAYVEPVDDSEMFLPTSPQGESARAVKELLRRAPRPFT